MVINIKTIYKIILIFFSFLIYNIESIDSNSDKILLYDRVNMHDENKFTVYFKSSINSYNLNDVLKDYNIEILSYIINDKKYYAKDTLDLIKKYTENLNLEDKIYYYINGINIEGLSIICENNEIIKLSNSISIY